MFAEIGKTLSQYDLAKRLNMTPETVVARLDFFTVQAICGKSAQ